jgi:hypothetical protein
MPQDSFTSALARLDPASRALLDLSLRRGMRPEEISDLLGTDPESVLVAREGALEQLARELGMADVSELDDVRARLAELPPEVWTGQAPRNGHRPREAKIEPVRERELKPKTGSEPKSERVAKPEPQRRRSRLPLLLAALALAAVIVVIALAAGGDGNGGTQAGSTTPVPKKQAKPKPVPAQPSSPSVPLTRIAASGSGS